MPQSIKVLIAEDLPLDAELMVRELRRAGFEPDWERVDTEAAYIARLVPGLDLVLSDYEMGGFNATRALELLKKSGLEVPFILVSGTIGEETAVAMIRRGATDYLMKDRLARLGEAASHALEEFRLRHEHRQADESLRTAHLQLGQLLEHSPAVLYMLKVDDEKITPYLISENITTLLGFSVAEASTYEWWAGQLHPDERERVFQSVAETLSAGNSVTEYRLRHKDGHYCWVDDTRRSIRDATGKPVEIVGVWTDITERKRAEEVLRDASSHVAQDRKIRVRMELAILVAVTLAVFLLASHFQWFESGTRWILTHQVLEFDEMILTTFFLTAGLAVFAYRRWRETETELTGRDQAQAAMTLLHDELDRQVKQRTGELERAGQSLNRSAQDFRLLFDRNPMPMWVYDLETMRFLAVNDAAITHYGYSQAEFLGMKIEDLKPSAESLLAKVKPAKPVRPVPPPQTWPHRKKDGTVMHMALTSHDIPFGDRKGQLVMAADETARQQAEDELRESEAGYRTLFEYAPDGIVIATPDSHYLDANASICRMLGYTREEMVKLHAADIVVTAEVEHVDPALGKIMAEGDYHREWQFRRKDGSTFPAEVLATKMPDGNLLGMIRDITERKRSEVAIHESEEYFHFLNDLVDATRTLIDPAQIMAVTARMLGQHLHVSRCAYADVEQDGDQFTILDDYTDNCASTVGSYQLSLFGPRAVSTLRQGQTLIIRNVAAELLPVEGAEMFAAIGIQAIITCPLVKEGGLRALMAVHQSTPRDWKPSEIVVVQDVVERCWATIERRRSDQRNREQLDELLRWQEVMLDREDRVQALKTEVNEQLMRQGEPSRYASAVAP